MHLAVDRRRLRELVVIGVVVAVVVSVVVAAVNADGRTSVRAETNDGGAWLVRRSEGIVGQLNRTAGEVSGIVRVANPGSTFDIEQADGTLVVHDEDAGELQILDRRTYQIANTVSVPAGVRVRAVEDGFVVWHPSPFRMWVLRSDQALTVVSLDDVAPSLATEGDGMVTTTFDGDLVILDVDGERLGVGDVFGGEQPTWTQIGPPAGAITALSAIGDDVLTLSDDGSIARLGNGGTLATQVTPDDSAPAVVLVQPAPDGSPLVAITDDGDVLTDASGADTDLGTLADLGAGAPLSPIAHDGCIFNVATAPPTFVRICNGEVDQIEPLTGAAPDALRIRLVNGWVWINDLSSGTLWIASTDDELERIDDWGNTLGNEGDEPDENPGEQEDGDTEENPDIGEIRDPEIDEDGVNEPPVARDDLARTRTDQPVVVDVIANDEDPDGDALMVTEVTGVPDDASVAVTGGDGAVQVIPAPGFTGNIDFGYTISDGRGATASANVRVEVVSNDASNRPPITNTDIAEVRGGASAAFNVLNNDSDPDGDTFVLSDVTAPTGRVIFDPSGEVNFTPDPASQAGTIELEYEIVDSFGATANGTIRVAIRLDTSNNEPRAVNDTATTVVGMPVSINVLKNDADPDNDPLTVAGLPQLVATTGNDNAVDEISLSDDGEFFFLPTVAGDYVFLYAIIDGSERDAAYIRVRVDEAAENRAPTAIRDDVTISRGDSRNVYVLENDTDPDGDVIGITGWSDGEGVQVEQVLGYAFRVTVLPDAPARTSFTYSISDGNGDPSTGTVVVAVSDNDTPDQPPVARPDTIEVRPGRTASASVLVNDYDPEGGTLRVVNVSDVPGADLRIGPGGQEIFVSVDTTTRSSFTFGYDVADEGGNQTGSLVQVRLVPIDDTNRPPVARPDVARTMAGRAVDIPVLANDSDPDGDAIQVETISAQPTFGSAVVGVDGTVRYTPRLGESGSDRFRYTVVDANGDRAVGEVVVGVLPADGENRPPTATNDTFTVIAGSDVQLLDVLVNDNDPDGDPLAISDLVAGRESIALDPSGSVSFEPPASLGGAASRDESFTYEINDGRGGTDEALVTVAVTESPVPLAPIAIDDIAGPMARGSDLAINVLANDSDPDGRVADLTIRSNAPEFPIGPDGVLTITDAQDTVRVPYTITDADGLASTAQVTVIVLDNVAPTVEPLAASTDFETPLELSLAGQSSDADGDDLTFACCDALQGGTVAIGASARNVLDLTFTPDAGFAGVASFSYLVDDQNGHNVSGIVEITVRPPDNTPPTAIDGEAQAEAGLDTPIALSQFVEDPDLTVGDELTFEIDPRGAPATVRGDAVVVSPSIDATGAAYEIAYTVTDRTGAAASAVLRVTVSEPNVPPPTAVADSARTTQGVAVGVPALANDVDPLGRGLTIIGANVTDGSGSASVSGGTVVYEPAASYFGAATVTYTVQDARGTANGTATGTISVTVIGRPGTPTTPQATADNATATVTWGLPPANGAPITGVELETDAGSTISLGAASSHTLNGLVNGRPYRFRVRAQNEAGWSEWSGWSAAVTPDTIPGRVATPTVQFGDGQLTVTWPAPYNEGSAITGYEIEIGGGRNEVVSRGTATTFVWTGLQNGTNYQFRITAINAAGRADPSPWSNPEHPLREPGAPGTPGVERGNRYLDLSWAPSPANGDPVIEYQVQMRSNPGVWVAVGSGTSYRWSDLPNGVEQQFQVRSRNRDPEWSAASGWSTPVKPCAVPDKPATPTAARGDGSATVTYALPGDQGCAITQTQIQANGSATNTASGSPHTFGGLSNGTAYTFRVRSMNEEGWGPWSDASNPVTPAGAPQGPGSISAANSGIGAVDLSWPAASPNGSALLRYEISVNDGGPVNVGLVTSTTRSGLANGTAYRFKVRACNDVDCGAWSPNAAVTTWGAPNQPGAPNASAGNRSVDASWGAPNNNGRPINGYDVELTPGGTRNVGGTSTSWGGLDNGTGYRVRVRACNAVGCSPWSAWSQTVTPRQPINVTASYYGNAQGQTGCSSSRCVYVRVEATGLSPNTDYVVDCHYRSRPGGFSPSTKRSDGNGNLVDPNACYYGQAEEFWATVGGRESNHLNAPPP